MSDFYNFSNWRNFVFRNNTAKVGGGLIFTNFHPGLVEDGSLSDFSFFNDSIFQGNFASLRGGGLFIMCDNSNMPLMRNLRLDLRNLSFLDNRAGI